MSDPWEGTCGFHNTPPEPGDFWPVGAVAFRTGSAELIQSAKALYVEAEYAPERADTLLAVAEWYEDLALDLAEIPDADIPF